MTSVSRNLKRLVKQSGTLAVLRLPKRLAKRAVPMGAVLLYHRVTELETDPQLLAVSPRNFAEHLEVLKRNFKVVSLGDLHSRTLAWPPRARLIALTFDDGYADNLYEALPLLQAYGIPATAFVVAGQLGQREEFWWDELERILLETPKLPDVLELTIGSNLFSMSLPSEEAKWDSPWHVMSDRPCSPRQAAYGELCNLVRPLSTADRQDFIGRLRAWAGVDVLGREGNRALTEDEVAVLARDGLVKVGAHTMTHPVLAAQPIAVQWQEIAASKRKLEEILASPVRCFSYPFGGREHYTSATVELVRDAGYVSACSNFSGIVCWSTSRFQIPRFIVRDWNGDEFARRLHAFFNVYHR